MTVKKRSTRTGKRRLVIEILYKHRITGKRERFRQDATMHTMAAAQEEERRLLAKLHTDGFLLTSQEKRKQVAEAPAVRPDVKLADAWDNYLKTKAVTRLKFTTRRGYIVSMTTYILPRWKGLPVASIGYAQVNELDADLTREGLKPSSRANVQCAIRSVLRHCVDTNQLEVMPRLPRLPKATERVLSIPDAATIAAMLEAAKPYLRLVLLLCVDAGLRAGEVRGATWRDIDLAAGKLVVRETVYHGHRDTPKSGHEREIHLTSRLKAALAEAARRPHQPHEPVAPNSFGRVWGESSLAHAVKALLGRLEKESHRFHDLRHYFVTSLFKLGVGAPTVRDLAGHRHMHVTARYAHSDDGSRRTAIAKLDEVAAESVSNSNRLS
jgi:integrase